MTSCPKIKKFSSSLNIEGLSSVKYSFDSTNVFYVKQVLEMDAKFETEFLYFVTFIGNE